jgi:uncharacterized protein (TIGR03435 family)
MKLVLSGHVSASLPPCDGTESHIMQWRALVIGLLVLASGAAVGQIVSAPAFEAASVKPAAPDEKGSGTRGGPGTADPGQATFSAVTLSSVLMTAYDVKAYQIQGPGWLDTEKYDIVAKIPAGTSKEQFHLMLQNLLAERFRMTLHHESKQFQGFELTIGKNGSKLKTTRLGNSVETRMLPGPYKIDDDNFPQFDQPGFLVAPRLNRGASKMSNHVTAVAQPLSSLLLLLSGQLQSPVVDRTGLTGLYDFRMEFVPEGAAAQPPPPDGGPDTLAINFVPGLITAVQDQLGLKLESKKIPLDVLVIDRADKVPTEN